MRSKSRVLDFQAPLPGAPSCSVDMCGQALHCKGFCKIHYERQKNGRQLDAPIKPRGLSPAESIGHRFGTIEVIGVTRVDGICKDGRSRNDCIVRCWCDVHAGSQLPKLANITRLRSGSTSSCRILSGRTDQELGLNGFYAQHCQQAKRRNRVPCDKRVFLSTVVMDCTYCGRGPEAKKFSENQYNANTVDRIDSRRGYEPDNVQALCKACNHVKGSIENALFSDSSFMNTDLSSRSFDERYSAALKSLNQYSRFLEACQKK